MERHILVVFPHPDDEAFGTAGVIAQHIQNGRPVTYACGTLGEMGRNMGSPLFANRETLPEIRKKELKDACAAIGLNDLRMLGLRDKTIEFEDPEKIADRIEEIIYEIQPSLVITHYPGFAVHPDHNALGEATIRAVKRIPENKRPKIYCHAFSKDTEDVLGEPDVVIDVSDVLGKKIAALKAHRSQMEVMISELDKKVEDLDPKLINWLSHEKFWFYKG